MKELSAAKEQYQRELTESNVSEDGEDLIDELLSSCIVEYFPEPIGIERSSHLISRRQEQ